MARVNDSVGTTAGDRPFLYGYGKKSGIKLFEKRLPFYTNGLYLLVRVSDTSFAVANAHPGGLPRVGQQKGGVTLRLYNLRLRQLWSWSHYGGTSVTVRPALLKLRQEPGQSLDDARLHFAVSKYDTTLRRTVHNMFTFRPEVGLLERIDTAAFVGNTDLYFEQNMTHPLPGNNWLTVRWVNGIKKASAVWLDSAFNVVREDTLSHRLSGRNEGKLSLLPAPDGGFTAIYSASAIPVSGTDSGSVTLERHDGQGNVLWRHVLPRNYYYPETTEPLADGGWLWIRATSKKVHEDSGRAYFERRDRDFDVVWRTEFPSLASDNGPARYSYRGVGFDGEGGGFVAGTFSPSGNSGDEYGYLARVTNLGLPYDPLAAKPSIVSAKGRLLAYPNPTSSILHIQGLPNKAVQLYSAHGQFLQTIKLDRKGSGKLNLTNLQKGVYLLRSQEKAVRIVFE